MQKSDYLYQIEMGSLIPFAKMKYHGLVCELHDEHYVYQDECGFLFHATLDEAIVDATRYINNTTNDYIYAVVKTMDHTPVYSIGRVGGKIITDFVGKRESDAPVKEITELDYILARREELRRKEAEEKERETELSL